MSKIHWKGSTLLGPVPPVMVTCGDMGKGSEDLVTVLLVKIGGLPTHGIKMNMMTASLNCFFFRFKKQF